MRARNIKPGFFTCPELLELPFEARLLFAGLWCVADREGRLEDRPARIKLLVLPVDEVDADVLLGQLAEAGFIERYQVDGERLILVTNFLKHQHPHHREAQSKYPPKPEASPRQALGPPDEVPGQARSDSHDSHDSHDSGTSDGWNDPEVAEGMRKGKHGYSKRR